MSEPKYGLAQAVAGLVRQIQGKMGNAGAVTSGNCLKLEASGSPYLCIITSGDKPIALGLETVSAPTTDGDSEVAIVIGPYVYCYLPVVTGTMLATMAYKTCDLAVSGTKTGLDVTAATDNVFSIIEPDVVNNGAYGFLSLLANFGTVV